MPLLIRGIACPSTRVRNKAGPPVPLSATTAFGIDVIDRAAANASLAALDAAAYRETSDPIDMEG